MLFVRQNIANFISCEGEFFDVQGLYCIIIPCAFRDTVIAYTNTRNQFFKKKLILQKEKV